MDTAQHNRITDFIWGIADDVLRDIYVRGKYRDVILPMTVVRRLDSVLEPTKDDVFAMKARLDAAVTDSPPTIPEPSEATPVPKTSRRPAGYRRFAGSVRRICVEAVRKARSLLPGAGSPPPKT